MIEQEEDLQATFDRARILSVLNKIITPQDFKKFKAGNGYCFVNLNCTIALILEGNPHDNIYPLVQMNNAGLRLIGEILPDIKYSLRYTENSLDLELLG